jgi:two-component system response regulator
MKPILQVEDDANDVYFLNRAMRKAEVAHPIQVATDGQQAIDYLKGVGKFADRELFPLPCLVLLDLKLPRVMGLDVLKWIRQQSGLALVVVLLTASGEEADIAAAYRLGANAFLTKPSEMNKLHDMAKAIKDFWLTHNTLPENPSPPAPAECVVRLVPSAMTDFTANRRPPADGIGREVWTCKPQANL